jgi:hypothetical protein
VSLGKRGARANVGLPGTGISYSTALGGRKGARGSKLPPSTASANSAQSGCGLVVLIGFVVLAIGTCSKNDNSGSELPIVTPTASKIAYVTSRSLNCRMVPDASATVVTPFTKGSTLAVSGASGTWTKVENAGQTCWVASQYISDAPPPATKANPSSRATKTSAIAAGGAAAYAAPRARPTKQRAKRKRSAGSYDAQGCPCSGSKVCIGPRGGRYCITSGGNKRYGV